MRQPKPWEALGMSRASWYRHHKPDVWPPPNALPSFYKALMIGARMSERTAFRARRVLNADPDLFHAVMDGAGTWGPAEWLILNPDAHRRWREANGLPWPVPPLPE